MCRRMCRGIRVCLEVCGRVRIRGLRELGGATCWRIPSAACELDDPPPPSERGRIREHFGAHLDSHSLADGATEARARARRRGVRRWLRLDAAPYASN